jgi:hypothetical protein
MKLKKITRSLGLSLLVLGISILSCATTSVSADTSAATNIDTIVSVSSASIIAKNAAIKYFGWMNVDVSNIKNLYDFNDSLIAYSVDIYNSSTHKNGYVIVSNSIDDEPIIQMSENTNSVFNKTIDNTDKCIYEGVGSYFAKDSALVDSKYYEISSKTKLPDDVVNIFKAEDKKKVHKSANVQSAQSQRQSLTSSNKEN